MNKQQFINTLRSNICVLPQPKINDVMKYYYGYFEYNHIDENSDVERILGNPNKIAEDIISNYKKNNPGKNYFKDSNSNNSNINGNMHNGYGNNCNLSNKNNNGRNIAIIVIGILLSPLIIAVGFGAASCALGIGISVIAIIIGISAVFLALALSGIVLFIMSFFLLPQSIATFIFYLGSSILIGSVGIILFYLEILLIYKIVISIKNSKKKGGKAVVQ